MRFYFVTLAIFHNELVERGKLPQRTKSNTVIHIPKRIGDVYFGFEHTVHARRLFFDSSVFFRAWAIKRLISAFTSWIVIRGCFGGLIDNYVQNIERHFFVGVGEDNFTASLHIQVNIILVVVVVAHALHMHAVAAVLNDLKVKFVCDVVVQYGRPAYAEERRLIIRYTTVRRCFRNAVACYEVFW